MKQLEKVFDDVGKAAKKGEKGGACRLMGGLLAREPGGKVCKRRLHDSGGMGRVHIIKHTGKRGEETLVFPNHEPGHLKKGASEVQWGCVKEGGVHRGKQGGDVVLSEGCHIPSTGGEKPSKGR